MPATETVEPPRSLLTIPSRYCRPVGRANGGRACGHIGAALDCPRGNAAAEAANPDDDIAILLGLLTDECRVIAWPIGHQGRKLMAGSALLGPTGRVLALARTVRLTVPRPPATVTGERTR